MTEERLRELLELWRPRLALERWLIEVRVERASDETCLMEIERSVYYERATLIVQPWLLGDGEIPGNVLTRELTEEIVEASLVHELLHLVVRDMRMVVRDDLDGFVSRDVHLLLETTFRRAEEQMVDRLALSLVRSFR